MCDDVLDNGDYENIANEVRKLRRSHSMKKVKFEGDASSIMGSLEQDKGVNVIRTKSEVKHVGT